jgi:hypothetical protein
MTIELSKIEKKSKLETLLESITKIVGTTAHPLLGGALTICYDYQNTIQYNNIIDVLRDFEEQLRNLKVRIDRIDQEDIPVIQQTIQIAKDDMMPEKRKLYASFLVACCHPNNSKCKIKPIYLNKLQQLDSLGLFILKNINGYKRERTIINDVRKIYDNSIENEDILSCLCNLESSLGLLEKRNAEELMSERSRRGGNRRILNPENVFYYKRNYLGEGLYNFIIKGFPIIATDN